jgi:hypothetical protein
LEHGNRVSDGEVLDISARGAKLRISERFEINSNVVLIIADLGRFAGEIRWQRNGYIGIAFSEMAIAIENRLSRRATPAAGAGAGTPFRLGVPSSTFKGRRRGASTTE